MPLPAGLVESQQLPEPIFTPATKAESGHDENISFDEMAARVGANVADELRRKVSKAGYDKLSVLEKKQLGKIDFQVKEHRAYWFDKLGNMHGFVREPGGTRVEFRYNVPT